jgi:hypothetical protein
MKTAIAQQLSLFGDHDPVPGENAVMVVGIDFGKEPSKTGTYVVDNSLRAHDRNMAALRNRKKLILDVLRLVNRPMTARQILEKIWPDTDDMNRVRPRITELLHEGKLCVTHRTQDRVTGEMVDVFWLA